MDPKCKSDLYTAYILIQNFESKLTELQFDKFSITRIDNRNYERLKEIFKSTFLKRQGQHFIERRYIELPGLTEDYEDPSGLGRIPYDSEDLMLLLRLFKTGDIVFVSAAVSTPENGLLSQYQYPMAFSIYRSPFHYKISEEDIPLFNEFFEDVPKWLGWNSSWFKIARRHFLWGGSKRFHPSRDTERILDYMISLEASFVSETDFVSRRLRERTASILGGSEKDKSRFKKEMSVLYAIRSALAHGNPLSSEQTRFLKEKRPSIEENVRRLLKNILKSCPSSAGDRRSFLSDLYDISDYDRAEKVISDFKAIKDTKIRDELLKKMVC